MSRKHLLPAAELTIKAIDFGFEYEMWPRRDDYAFGLKNVIVRKSKLMPTGSNETSIMRLEATITDASALVSGNRGARGELRLVDGWLLREQFLKIKTPDDALRFFKLTGLIFLLSTPKRKERPFVALFSDVRRCQEMVADALVSPVTEHRRRDFPADWQCGLGTLPLTLRVVDESPTAEMIFDDGLTAIMATVHIDRACGTEFQRCMRCAQVYQRESQHQRMYCSYACGHAAAEQMRRDRKRKKKPRKASGGKEK